MPRGKVGEGRRPGILAVDALAIGPGELLDGVADRAAHRVEQARHGALGPRPFAARRAAPASAAVGPDGRASCRTRSNYSRVHIFQPLFTLPFMFF